MKLLIITQKIDKNDSNLGFFHSWLIEFAKHYDSIVAICLEEGEHELPANVKVLSLGKERNNSRIRYVLNFYKYIWNERNNYDVVFVHMNQIYVIMGGLLWRLLGKKISLWYTHKSVTFSLKVAEKLVNRIFSASKESFRLSSNKLLVTGHGIDTDFFIPSPVRGLNDSLDIITVGRIAPVKKREMIIEAIKSLKDGGDKSEVNLTIVGGPIQPEDFKYQEKLKEMVRKNDMESVVKFVGPVKPQEVVGYLQGSNLFVHESQTGSLDKAALEAMACGLIVISANDALRPILEPYGLVFEKGNVISLLNMLIKVNKMEGRKEIGEKLRGIVIRDHSLRSLISLIAEKLNE